MVVHVFRERYTEKYWGKTSRETARTTRNYRKLRERQDDARNSVAHSTTSTQNMTDWHSSGSSRTVAQILLAGGGNRIRGNGDVRKCSGGAGTVGRLLVRRNGSFETFSQSGRVHSQIFL
jgi:hypothetical protein